MDRLTSKINEKSDFSGYVICSRDQEDFVERKVYSKDSTIRDKVATVLVVEELPENSIYVK